MFCTGRKHQKLSNCTAFAIRVALRGAMAAPAGSVRGGARTSRRWGAQAASCPPPPVPDAKRRRPARTASPCISTRSKMTFRAGSGSPRTAATALAGRHVAERAPSRRWRGNTCAGRARTRACVPGEGRGRGEGGKGGWQPRCDRSSQHDTSFLSVLKYTGLPYTRGGGALQRARKGLGAVRVCACACVCVCARACVGVSGRQLAGVHGLR